MPWGPSTTSGAHSSLQINHPSSLQADNCGQHSVCFSAGLDGTELLLLTPSVVSIMHVYTGLPSPTPSLLLPGIQLVLGVRDVGGVAFSDNTL